MKEIFEILEQLKDYLKTELTGQNKNIFACAIANSLEETYPMEYNTFTGETIFDLLQILDSAYLKKYEKLQIFQQRLLEIISTSGDEFIHTFIGKTAYDAGYKKYYRSKPDIIVSGICIYFPKSSTQNAYIKPFFNSINYESDLEKGLKWYDDVIETYLAIMNN
ncbi:MAG: hypothetical protein IPL50_05630 [Chitinophagaceae bacterium]|nr:hypothetical protein [Chitinophagaceae bacterium]